MSENHIPYKPSPAIERADSCVYKELLGESEETLAELKKKRVI